MSDQAALGAAVAAAVCLAATPYLARLTVTVPDRELRRWWPGRAPTRPVLIGTAVTGLVVGGFAGAAAGWTALLPAFAALALVGTPLVVIDFQVHRLPNRLVLPGFVAGAVLLTAAAWHWHAWHPLLRALEGAAAVYAVLWLLATFFPQGFGLGDARLGGILGGYLGWFGWAQVYYGILGGFVLGAVLAVGLLASGRATMKTAVPFGPMLLLGPLIVLAFDLVP